MRKTIEICKCDRCGEEVNYLYPVKGMELCESCKTQFNIWFNKSKKSDKALEMLDNGYSSHDCESHYKCPICGKDYGGWSIPTGKEFECSCGQKLIVRS